MAKVNYNFLKEKLTSKIWEKVGFKRRAGVMCPLFSILSKTSVGIGEFKDLKYMIDWCKLTGHSILQLLPLNDIGAGNSPYSSVSSFALEPAYISLSDVKGKTIDISSDLKKLQKKYPANTDRLDYKIRPEKLAILKKIFETAKLDYKEFADFKTENKNWLDDYAVYKTLKEMNAEKSWLEWDEKFKFNKMTTAESDELNLKSEFYKWVQWQLFEQFKKMSDYARENGILLMGDIPFLVSKDSADVWGQYRNCFNLDIVAGCPPDSYNFLGQKWGMPGYNWQVLKKHNFDYFVQKLKYAGNFYDLYRIDHVVGMFRLWTINISEPEETGGLNGQFNPADEKLWKENGSGILQAMIQATEMLPCAEDLGVVPAECTQVLEELGIAGLEVQRWLKHRDTDVRHFKKPDEFRKIACAVSSGHDMSNTASMWKYEFETIDELSFKKICEQKGIDFYHVAPKLFDLEKSKHGRFNWKNDVANKDILLWNLGKPYDEVYNIVDAYNETFNEKKLLIQNIKCGKTEADYKNLQEIVWDILNYTSSSESIYFVNSILDVMFLEQEIDGENLWNFRINTPGTVGDQNWTLRIPIAAEKLKSMKINKKLLDMNLGNNRG